VKLVQAKLLRRDISDHDTCSELGQLNGESPRPRTDLENTLTGFDELPKKTAMDLKTHAATHRCFETVPLAITQAIVKVADVFTVLL
jgi:hypothetical protein